VNNKGRLNVKMLSQKTEKKRGFIKEMTIKEIEAKSILRKHKKSGLF